MTRSRKLILFLIAFVPVVVLVIFSVGYVRRQIGEMSRYANLIIADELSRRFEKEVRVGDARVGELGTAVIEDVRIAKGKTFAEGTLGSVRKVVIRYDWRAMLYGGKGAASVSVVEVTDPAVQLVRRADGSFNITELLKPPPGPRKPPFAGKVLISGGRVEFLDYAVRRGQRPIPIHLRDVRGSLLAATHPVYRFSGTSRGTRGQFASAVFNGSYHANSKRALVHVDARTLLAPLLVPYVFKSNKVQVAGGTLDAVADLDIRRTNGRYALAISGVANVRNATVGADLLKPPVTGVSGTVALKGERVALALRGRFAGGAVQATGVISDFRSQTLDVLIASPSIDVDRLIASTAFLGALSQFDPSGRGPVRARLTGKLSNLTVEATALVPRASVRGIAVQSVSVSALYRSGRVDLRSARMLAKGADVWVSGYVTTLPATSLNLHGTFANLALSSIPIKTDFAVTGRATGAFTLVGPAAHPIASVTARVANGSVADVPFSSIEGNLAISGTRVGVNDLRVEGVFQGSVRASGVVSGTAFDLRVTADSIDIASLGQRLGQAGYGGTAFLDGHVYGSVNSPHVDGSLEVFEGRAEGQAIDHARFTFAADRNRITVSEGLLQLFPAELRISGQASGLSSSRVAFAGKASVGRLEMAKLLELSKREIDVSGTILGDFGFSGVYLPDAAPGKDRFADLAAAGSLTLEDATAFSYPVSETTAKIDYANKVIRLADATITSDGAKLTLNGTVATDTHDVDGGFALTGFDLARLHEFIGGYVVLAGTAGATGKVWGPWDNVNGSISAKVDGLSVNYERFDRAEAQLSYDDGKFASYSLELARATQSLMVTGTDFDPETQCIASANGVLTDISVPDILSVVRASPIFSSEEGKPVAKTLDDLPKISTGRMNGSFSVSGCLLTPEGEPKLPDGTVDLTATKVGLDVQQIQSIELHASAKSGVVSIAELSAVSDDTRLEVTGDKAYEDGIVHVEVRADNLRLSQLNPWLRINTLEGALSAEFNIDGAWGAPEIIGSVDVVKPGYGGFAFDSLRASQVRIMATRIEVPDVLLSIGGHQAAANASVPWNWATVSIPKDEPISFSATLPKQSLSILNAFIPLIDTAKTSGTVEASFQLSGTLLDPLMQGSGKIADGAVSITGLTNTFANVAADLAFDGDRLVVNKMSASSSLGGNVHVVPGGYVSVGLSGTSEVNLKVVADRLTMAEKNLLGMKETVSTQIDAGLSIAGPPATPMIADAAIEGKQGGIALSRTKASFQIVPKAAQWSPMLALNPRFDVTLRIGQDVVISPPSLELAVKGEGKLTGSLAQPIVDGMVLQIVTGEISLATARLRIMPGGSVRVSYAPPAEPDVSLDFQATTSVFAVNSLRQRERYQVTMRVTGQASKPNIDLSSSPPGLNREQMLAALGHVPGLFTSAEAGLQQELAGALTAVGASTLFAPIENIFIQKLGFEQFSLDYSPIYPLSLYVSRPLFGNWYIAFFRQITSSLLAPHDTQYQVVLSYRWKGIYQFSSGIDDQQTVIFQVGYARAFR